MAADEKIHNRNIRWLTLMILHEQRKGGRTESGGWLSLPLLRKLLAAQGYDLTVSELLDHMIYLQDKEIACTETKKVGEIPPYTYKFRITAKGVRSVSREEKVPGIGLYGDEEE